jgi:O-antigen ligase
LVVAALIGVVAFASDNSAVKGVVDLPNDQRVESRLDMLNEAVDLAWESPITGWGPGSSATATRLDFVEAGKVHVKPHNGALGIIIESGIIGLTLFCLLCGSTLLNLWRSSRLEKQKRMTGVAAAAVIPLVGFWSFGDALAALPITLCLGLIVGIYLANGFADERPQGANID